MTAPASQTRIVNKAAVLLGTLERIVAITDSSALAITAKALWDETRDEVMADHPWNFALSRAALAASADEAPAGSQYAYAYELPQDNLRWLPWRPDHVDHFEGEQEGRYILSNAAAPIYVRYIRRVEDLSKWSAGYIEALTAKLAMYMAKPITGQSGMIDRMARLYEQAIANARRQDGLASGRTGRTASYRSHWLAARNGGVGRM
ncbi:MAG TPA: hypothetical protein VGW34_03840 [Allosphingosinicella sp.]|nr:hypothetical protein [Allosphingosinicella sp.]